MAPVAVAVAAADDEWRARRPGGAERPGGAGEGAAVVGVHELGRRAPDQLVGPPAEDRLDRRADPGHRPAGVLPADHAPRVLDPGGPRLRVGHRRPVAGLRFRALMAHVRPCGPPPPLVVAPVNEPMGNGTLTPVDGTLGRFSAPVRAWFASAFEAPTRAQADGWPAISAGEHTLLLAPTGSGKTLAAFLWAIDRLSTDAVPASTARCRVLYVSPLKALAVDIERNLRAPLVGLQRNAERLGVDVHVPTVGVRTGDTPADERRRLARTPPDILITTPESLYLLLTSRARETLRSVRWVIVDEIHAVAGTKRGRAPRGVPRAARGAAPPSPRSASGCRPPSGPSTRSPGSSAGSARPGRGRCRSSTPARPRTWTSRWSSPSRTSRRWARSSTSRSAGRPRPARPGPASGPTCIRGCSSSCRPTAPRSSSSTPAGSPSGSPRA